MTMHRYDHDWSTNEMLPADDGEYVEYSEHFEVAMARNARSAAALAEKDAEIARLRGELKNIALGSCLNDCPGYAGSSVCCRDARHGFRCWTCAARQALAPRTDGWEGW